MPQGGSFLLYEGKAGDDFWVKAETLLYCALIGYIHYEAPVEEQNFSTLIEFINAMEVREDDEEFKNPVDLMFDALEAEKPNHFAVRQYKKYKTTPPKHFTEDTLLSAMETAGKDDMPDNAERKGLGTPATRAGILEKLVSTGFLERKKSKKTVQLLPSHDAVSLITVLPEQLQSPLLTAEWEYRLGEIERGELAPEDFMARISTMLQELVRTYQVIKIAS